MMRNLMKTAMAACAGAVALAGSIVQPANAADIPAVRQYSAPVEQEYVYRERVYRPAPPPAVVYEAAPPAVVVVPEPEPYYVVPRRVYAAPYYYGGYRHVYGHRPYFAGGYGHHRGWGHGHRRW